MRKEELGVMRWFDILASLLLVLGGLLLGVGSVAGYDIITSTLTNLGVAGRIVFFVIGVSAVYEIVGLRSIFRRWNCRISMREPQSSVS